MCRTRAPQRRWKALALATPRAAPARKALALAKALGRQRMPAVVGAAARRGAQGAAAASHQLPAVEGAGSSSTASGSETAASPAGALELLELFELLELLELLFESLELLELLELLRKHPFSPWRSSGKFNFRAVPPGPWSRE